MKSKKQLTRRAFCLGLVQTLLIGGVAKRFYDLQIDNEGLYKVLSDKNRIRTVIIVPERGIIKDNNNRELASNKATHVLVIQEYKEQLVLSIIREVKIILQRNPSIVNKNIKKIIRDAQYKGEYLILEDNLSWHDIKKIESNMWHYNDYLQIISISRRFYHEGETLGHITGYVSKPNSQEISENKNLTHYSEFYIGRNGIEKSCEDYLQGTAGIRSYESNAHNKTVRNLSYVKPKQGSDIKLSIDSEIQRKVRALLNQRNGSVTVLNVQDESVAAMYSYPSYNPNIFTEGVNQEKWHEIINNKNNPLLNKAISCLYPPGSTFKVVTALAILKSDVNLKVQIFCDGKFKLGNRIYHCWKKHGYVDFYQALRKSCNLYFYNYSLKVGIETIAKVSEELGFGQKTNIELPFEKSGNIPTKQWKKFNIKQNWHIGDTLNTSIGQGYVLVTPLQLANMMLKIVKKRNSIITILNDKDFNNINNVKPLNINYDHLHLIKENLYEAMNSSRVVAPNQMKIAGKTGTAQVISQRKVLGKNMDHSLFVGFAPYDNPKYIISTIIEHGGWGSAAALPLAKEIFQEIL